MNDDGHALPNEGGAESQAGADMDFFGDVPAWTPEIDRACQKVAHWIRCDFTGGMVYGLQHIGKSACAQFIAMTIPAILGPRILIELWPTDEHTKKSPENILAGWIRRSGCQHYNQKGREKLQYTLYDYLIDKANAANATRILIIIDDAHWLQVEAYALLMSLTNELKISGKRPFVLQIGQPELLQVKNTFTGGHSLQIVSRFFGVQHEYLGIKLEDLAEFLMELEKSREHGFSSHFLPHLAKRGFSLKDMAEPMRVATQTIAESQSISTEVRLPMGRLRSSLCSMFYRLRADASIQKVGSDLIHDCFQECGLPSVLGFYARKGT